MQYGFKKGEFKVENLNTATFPIFSQKCVFFPKIAKNFDLCEAGKKLRKVIKKFIIYYVYNIGEL